MLVKRAFLIHSRFNQRFSWFGDYVLAVFKYIGNHSIFKNPWFLIAAFILPVILPVTLLYHIFSDILFGFFGLIISIVIFLYCLGPKNVFYPVYETNTVNDDLVENYFFMANRQLFSVIFWYLFGGPIVVLIYRLISLCQDISMVSLKAAELTHLFEWIPARITALLYLLVGNFQRGFAIFTGLFLSAPNLNNQLLSGCGLQAAKTNETDEVSISRAESLVDQAIIVCMVVIAFLTLAACL